MTRLIKDVLTDFIPGNPASPGHPFVPAQPARTVAVPVTTCTPGGVPAIITVKVLAGQSLASALGLPPNTSISGSIVNIIDVDSNHDGVIDYTVYTIQTSGQSVCTTSMQPVFYPATPAVPAVPAAPPTAAQISVSLNQGWNSSARTVDVLPPGSCIEYTIKLGSYGVLVALAQANHDGYPIGTFSNGVVADVSGIHVFENGVQGQQLAAANLSGMILRICRLDDGQIAYQVDNGVVVISGVNPGAPVVPIYVYTMLYSGYDEVDAADFAVLDPTAEPYVVLAGVGGLIVSRFPTVLMPGIGGLIAKTAPLARLPGDTAMWADAQAGGRGEISLPLFQALGGDYAFGGIGDVILPEFTALGFETGFTPAVPTTAYINLPVFVAWGQGSDTDIGTADIILPEFQALGGDYTYGLGDVSLPAFLAGGSGDFVAANEMVLISTLLGVSVYNGLPDLVMILTSLGTLESAFTMTRLQVLDLLSGLVGSSVLTLSGTYDVQLLSSGSIASLQSISLNNRPDLNDGAVVWVLNRENNASSVYEEFGFNSFFERDGQYFGVANDGIYLLEGEDDAGEPIKSLIDVGRSNLGYTHNKRIMQGQVYISSGSELPLQLKINVDGREWNYQVKTAGMAVRNRCLYSGWAVKGAFWDFILSNKDGSDFELHDISFTPVVLPFRG